MGILLDSKVGVGLWTINFPGHCTHPHFHYILLNTSKFKMPSFNDGNTKTDVSSLTSLPPLTQPFMIS